MPTKSFQNVYLFNHATRDVFIIFLRSVSSIGNSFGSMFQLTAYYADFVGMSDLSTPLMNHLKICSQSLKTRL